MRSRSAPAAPSTQAGPSRRSRPARERDFAAAFDSTGAVQPWDPAPDGDVYALEVSGAAVYAGGAFESVDDIPRSATRQAGRDRRGRRRSPAGIPMIIGDVFQISAPGDGSTVYVGGNFQNVDAETRDNVAAFDASTSALTPFAPLVGGEVDALALSGSRIGFGGEFRTAGGARGRRDAAPALEPRGDRPRHRPRDGLEPRCEQHRRDPRRSRAPRSTQAGRSPSRTGSRASGSRRSTPPAPRRRGTPASTTARCWRITVVGDTVYAGGTFSGTTSVSTPPVERNFACRVPRERRRATASATSRPGTRTRTTTSSPSTRSARPCSSAAASRT